MKGQDMAASAKQENEQQAAGSNARREAERVVLVVISGTAGGLQAQEAHFPNLAQDNVAYVIVQHTDSDYRSYLSQLVKEYAPLKVLEAQHNMPVEAKKVYVIPHNHTFTIKNNLLQLSNSTNLGRSGTGDTFSNSLADNKNGASGVTLSDTGSDGTEAASKKGGKVNEPVPDTQQEENISNAEHFRILLEAVPHITWTNKPNGENISFNELWYEYTGLTREESIKWGWKSAIHPSDLDNLLSNFLSVLRNGEVFNTEARIFNKATNQYRWHLIKDVPIRHEDGVISLWIGTATDIQDQKDAEEANIQFRLTQQREILSAILQTQETERSRISEALHNGLGQILYAAKLNLNNLDAADDKQEKGIASIDKLLSESVTITRNISAELSPAVLKDFGLKTATEEAISRFNCPNLKITSEIKGFDKRLDYNVELSLYRIVQELLNNILKHAQATEAKVTMVCTENEITVRVEDNGIGISKEDFHKLKGIGLSSIQNRLELLQGKMEVQERKGGGSVFEIRCSI
ncbi:hypothetical protein GCM10027443_06100 [Pontibacter brevis]